MNAVVVCDQYYWHDWEKPVQLEIESPFTNRTPGFDQKTYQVRKDSAAFDPLRHIPAGPATGRRYYRSDVGLSPVELSLCVVLSLLLGVADNGRDDWI